MICLVRSFVILVLILVYISAVTIYGQKTPTKSSRMASKPVEQQTDQGTTEDRSDEGEEPTPFSRYGYAYSMGQTEIGASGLFSVFDAYTLRKKEFRAGVFVDNFARSPGNLRLTQVPLQVSVGLTNHLELFFGTNPYQHVHQANPSTLSGNILRNSILSSGVNPNLLVNANSQGFFLLPGLPVSGALSGGILPGLPGTGQTQQVFDPILNLQKSAFSQSSFYNDLPFVATNGTSYGDTTIGAKVRLIDFTARAAFDQVAILGYVKVPASRTNSILAGGNSALFRGAGSGTTDFGLFVLHSLYLPKPGAKKSSTNSKDPKQNADPLPKIIDTINLHFNFGYVRNGDPGVNGTKLIDRKDSIVTAFGMDSMLNRFVQAIGELKYTKLIDPGVPNSGETNPGDITAGFRFYPAGMPEQVSICDHKKSTNRFFFALGGGYKYSFNLGSIGGAIGNHHGFIFSLTTGRSNNEPKLDVCDKSPVGSCEKSESERPLTIESLTIDKTSVKRGDEIRLTAQVKNKYKAGIQYKWEFPNSQSITKQPETTFRVSNLKAAQGYRIKLTVSYSVKDLPCPAKTKEVTFDVINNPPSLTLSPASVGPISANTPQDITLLANATDPDGDPLTLSWRVPPEIVLSGSERDAERSFSSRTLKAGQRYAVIVTASDGEETVEKRSEISVNNPPTVALRAEHPNLQGVAPGDPLRLVATGNDLDNDSLTYAWQLTGTTTEGISVSRSLSNDRPGNNVLALMTQDFETGKYLVSVTASDSLDTSGPAQAAFEIVRRAPEIFFEFDKYRLVKKERVKLDAEAGWLGVDQNRTIEIRCEGNADRVAGPNYNLRLGCKRACTARAYLIKKGIVAERITIAVSFGERKADQNRQRSTDRRVDLSYARREGVVSVVPPGAENCNCSQALKTSKRRIKARNR